MKLLFNHYTLARHSYLFNANIDPFCPNRANAWAKWIIHVRPSIKDHSNFPFYYATIFCVVLIINRQTLYTKMGLYTRCQICKSMYIYCILGQKGSVARTKLVDVPELPIGLYISFRTDRKLLSGESIK